MPRLKKKNEPAKTPSTTAPTAPAAPHLNSVIQRRKREKVYQVQAAFSLSVKGTETQVLAIRSVLNLLEQYRNPADGTNVEIYNLTDYAISDPSGFYKDADELDYVTLANGEKVCIFTPFEGLVADDERHASRAAQEIASALNTVMTQINAANMTNAQRLETAKTVCENVLNNVISRHGEKVYLKARSREGFKKRLEKEIKIAAKTVDIADYNAVNISVDLENDLIDARDLSISRETDRKKTPVYKRLKRDVMAERKEVAQQLLLFDERVNELVSNSLLNRADGGGIALVWAVLRMRQEARQYAKLHGLDLNSDDPVDMSDFGKPECGFFPDGLRGSSYTVRANDVLKYLGLPYQGTQGMRERKHARQMLDEFAALEYVQRWEKAGARRHSFDFDYYVSKGREYWRFANFTRDFLVPSGTIYDRAEVDYIPYVYKHWNGPRTTANTTANEIIKFMTIAATRLHQATRRRIAELQSGGNAAPLRTPHTEQISLEINLADNCWPKFKYKKESEAAKDLMRAAFEACGITVTGGEGKGRSITISAEIIIDAKTQPPLLK